MTPHERKMARWRHHGFFGSVRMAYVSMNNIQTADTTTSEAKQLAANIQFMLEKLQSELKTRIDK